MTEDRQPAPLDVPNGTWGRYKPATTRLPGVRHQQMDSLWQWHQTEERQPAPLVVPSESRDRCKPATTRLSMRNHQLRVGR